MEQEVAAVKERISRRRRDLERQLSQPALTPLQFQQGSARLTGWQIVDQPVGSIMEQASSPDGKAALRIHAAPVTSASWRSKVLLEKGRYRFEGAVRTAGVEPLDFGKNKGASLRVLATPRASAGNLIGDQAWRTVQADFELAVAQEEIELICELVQKAGKRAAIVDLATIADRAKSRV